MALQYQRKTGIPTFSPGLIKHIPLYEKALQIGITVISVWGGNKRVYKSNNYYDLQIALYFIQGENDHWGHFTVITKINALLSKSYIAKTVIRCSITLNCTDAMYGVTFVAGVNVYLAKKP